MPPQSLDDIILQYSKNLHELNFVSNKRGASNQLVPDREENRTGRKQPGDNRQTDGGSRGRLVFKICQK